MQVVINGENRELNGIATVTELLHHLDLHGNVAIEINREIVPRSEFQHCPVRDGDQIEIVRAIGGG